nr:TfoX/Sxy family protein [Streptomyces scabichelini]
MFGLAFLLGGHMFCGVVHDELMIRLGPEGAAETPARLGVRPMDFTGRTMKSMVFVAPEALAGAALDEGVSRAVAHARTLPPKWPERAEHARGADAPAGVRRALIRPAVGRCARRPVPGRARAGSYRVAWPGCGWRAGR